MEGPRPRGPRSVAASRGMSAVCLENRSIFAPVILNGECTGRSNPGHPFLHVRAGVRYRGSFAALRMAALFYVCALVESGLGRVGRHPELKPVRRPGSTAPHVVVAVVAYRNCSILSD